MSIFEQFGNQKSGYYSRSLDITHGPLDITHGPPKFTRSSKKICPCPFFDFCAILPQFAGISAVFDGILRIHWKFQKCRNRCVRSEITLIWYFFLAGGMYLIWCGVMWCDDDPLVKIRTQIVLHRGLTHFPNREHVSHNVMNSRAMTQNLYPTNTPHYPYPSWPAGVSVKFWQCSCVV